MWAAPRTNLRDPSFGERLVCFRFARRLAIAGHIRTCTQRVSRRNQRASQLEDSSRHSPIASPRPGLIVRLAQPGLTIMTSRRGSVPPVTGLSGRCATEAYSTRRPPQHWWTPMPRRWRAEPGPRTPPQSAGPILEEEAQSGRASSRPALGVAAHIAFAVLSDADLKQACGSSAGANGV